MMIQRLFSTTLASCTFAFYLFFFNSINAEAEAEAEAEALKPEPIHKSTTLEVINKLQRRHFSNQKIDDDLSQEFLKNYLAIIDNNRQSFLQQEIEAFTKKYGNKLDDALKSGDVSPGYNIFNIYRQRMITRLNSQLANLSKTIKALDYHKKESITLDRSDAPWPKNQNDMQDLTRKYIKAAALSLRLSGKASTEIITLLTKRYRNQLERLKNLNNEDVYQLYINAFTRLYDPHTNYLSPTKSKNFDISMSLKLEGIGAMLRMKDGHTKIVRLIHAGPAFKQGQLKPSDRIVGVGQGNKDIIDVIGWRLDEVVNLIRGPKDSKVRLEIIPAKALSDEERKIITIIRDEVKLEEQSVQKAMLEIKDEAGKVRKIGVLDIPTFYIDFNALRKRDPNYKSTTRDTAKLLSQLIEEGAEGIVIDLRNNGGGSLREANELTGLFIEKGPSVQIKSSSGRTNTHTKNYFSPYYDGPLVVLINRLSASASEIFAGAMQDYDRAVIVGSTSFGKGTVQSLSPLKHGKFKITESKFYRISGESTQNKGVTADIQLPALYDTELIGESSLDHAMPWDSINPARYNMTDFLDPLFPELNSRSAKRIKSNDFFDYVNNKLIYEDSLDIIALSLNEEERKLFNTKDKIQRLILINQLRKIKGEKPLNELEEDNDNDNDNSEPPNTDIDKKDAYLIEAANILLDVKQLKQARKSNTATKN